SLFLQSCFPSLTVPVQEQETLSQQPTRHRLSQDLKLAEHHASLQAIEPPFAEGLSTILYDAEVPTTIDSQKSLALAPVGADKEAKQRNNRLLSKTTHSWTKVKR